VSEQKMILMWDEENFNMEKYLENFDDFLEEFES
jgi:hypothetical protein